MPPTRICDVGGWTDTHFAKYGTVLNVATYPYVEVQIRTLQTVKSEPRIVVSVDNFNETYTLTHKIDFYDKHPLIEAAINIMKFPEDISFKINIFSYAPPGASMGTSAAVSVALIGALDALTDNYLTSHEAAKLAHSIETNELKLECGIQDQLASAYGGISYIDIYGFPNASISRIAADERFLWDLEQRLITVYIGTPHSSSEIHKKVIKSLGANAESDWRLCELRNLAFLAKNAIHSNNVFELGEIFNRNTEVQRKLHKELVCNKFEDIISVANDFNSIGCKVNGAGGDGGSITILTNGDLENKLKLITILEQKGYYILPVRLSKHGLRVWKTELNQTLMDD